MAQMGYGDVREYVRQRAGAVDISIVEVLMVQALQDMQSDIGELESLVTMDLNLTADNATYTVPVGVDNLLSILDENGCPLARHEPSCTLSTCRCAVQPYRAECEMAYKVDAGTITFYPTPTEAHAFTIKAYGTIDTTLYDMDGQTKVWRFVALPVGLHVAFANRVLGMLIADFDPGRAQIWLSFSNQSMEAWKKRMGASGEVADETVVFGRKGMTTTSAWDTGYNVEVFTKVTEP